MHQHIRRAKSTARAHLEENGNVVEEATQRDERSLLIEAPCLAQGRLFIGHRDGGIGMEASVAVLDKLGQIPLHDVNTREDVVRQELLKLCRGESQ
jgi:hypothetical protein